MESEEFNRLRYGVVSKLQGIGDRVDTSAGGLFLPHENNTITQLPGLPAVPVALPM